MSRRILFGQSSFALVIGSCLSLLLSSVACTQSGNSTNLSMTPESKTELTAVIEDSTWQLDHWLKRVLSV
jgi:hypothetical protein